MTSITGRITLDGPFFSKNPGDTVRENIHAFLEGVAQDAETKVRDVLRAGEPGRAPVRELGADARVSQYVVGRVESLVGKRWQLHAVVSPSRKGLSKRQAIALTAAASKIERRVHVFRQLRAAGRASRHDFAKGLS